LDPHGSTVRACADPGETYALRQFIGAVSAWLPRGARRLGVRSALKTVSHSCTRRDSYRGEAGSWPGQRDAARRSIRAVLGVAGVAIAAGLSYRHDPFAPAPDKSPPGCASGGPPGAPPRIGPTAGGRAGTTARARAGRTFPRTRRVRPARQPGPGTASRSPEPPTTTPTQPVMMKVTVSSGNDSLAYSHGGSGRSIANSRVDVANSRELIIARPAAARPGAHNAPGAA
jgi:hypothetical protein